MKAIINGLHSKLDHGAHPIQKSNLAIFRAFFSTTEGSRENIGHNVHV